MPSADPKYQHILRAVYERPWAILPSTLALIVDIIRFRAAGGVLSDDEISARVSAAQNGPRKGQRQSGTVAVIPIYGPISQRQNMMSASSGGTSIEQLTSDFRGAMADDQVDGIVLEVDSPGGTVDMVEELATEIRAARGAKPIVAIANVMAASAAYWIASSADEIVVTPSGYVGSIGVFTAHEDLSAQAEMDGVKVTLVSAGRFKTEGNPWEPLSEEGQANLQDQVNQVYATFVAAVAKGRGVPVDDVRHGYGEGRVMLAKDALAAGMVDRIDTLDNTIRRVARQAIAGPNASMAALDTELPFTARLALVSAGAAELVEHATARLDMRAKQGRPAWSPADRAGLLSVADSLRALADEEADDPEPEPPEAAASSARAKVVALRRSLVQAEYGITSEELAHG